MARKKKPQLKLRAPEASPQEAKAFVEAKPTSNRTGLYAEIDSELKHKLEIACAIRRRNQRDIVEEAIRMWLDGEELL